MSSFAGAQFDFMAYLRQSMEDDYASLVGLGLAMWVFLIVFVLLSSVWGKLTHSSSPCQVQWEWYYGI